MSSDDTLDRMFKGLANRTRRQICDELKLRPLTTGQLCEIFATLDRTTVMQHIGALERAGLIVAVRKGRDRINYLDAMPIKAIHDRWIGPHAAHAADRLAELKFAVEGAKKIPSDA